MLQLHRSKIERVYDSGLVDARSLENGALFIRINIVRAPGNDTDYDIDDECLVVSDGNNHYILGEIRPTIADAQGNTTIRNSRNDLTASSGSVSLCSDDEFGNYARIVVGRGVGIYQDVGDYCATHLDPGNKKYNEYIERRATYSIPIFQEFEHNGIQSNYLFQCRTTVDASSMKRDLEEKNDPSKNIGSTFCIDIRGSSCSFEEWFNGQSKTSIGVDSGNISITNDGKTTIESEGNIEAGSNNDIVLLASKDFKVTASTGKIVIETLLGKIEVRETGGISIMNKNLPSSDLITIVDQLILACATSVVPTALGPQQPQPLASVALLLQQLILPLKA